MFLRQELADAVGVETLMDLAASLPGQWVPKPDLRIPGPGVSAEDLRGALGHLLDEFDAGIREVPVRQVDRWDNQPPEKLPDELPVLAPEERAQVLRATAGMRLAVVSEDYMLAAELWGTVSPALAKVASFAQEQAVGLVGDARKQLASAARLAVLAGLDWAIRVLDHSGTIEAVLKALHLH